MGRCAVWIFAGEWPLLDERAEVAGELGARPSIVATQAWVSEWAVGSGRPRRGSSRPCRLAAAVGCEPGSGGLSVPYAIGIDREINWPLGRRPATVICRP